MHTPQPLGNFRLLAPPSEFPLTFRGGGGGGYGYFLELHIMNGNPGYTVLHQIKQSIDTAKGKEFLMLIFSLPHTPKISDSLDLVTERLEFEN